MKFIVNPERKRENIGCPLQSQCRSLKPICPALGTACPRKNKECGIFIITLCADCSEDPKFCGGDVNVLE